MRVVILLLFYLGLLAIMLLKRRELPFGERRTFWVLFWVWGVSMFVANFLMYRAGLASFLPWLNK